MPDPAASPATRDKTLAQWLHYIEALHPKSIAMGLERVNEVKHRLQPTPSFPLIIVAGTNGKGSTCAMLERIYHAAGYRVACYTSPHLLHYNERVRVDCRNIADDDLVLAFEAVEAARQDTQLTYFEYGTLAAMWHFMQASVDIAILEVGLGGRLDAVNAFEPQCSIVTSIDLDHVEFLGNSRESIGFEKAGIFRNGVPAIYGDLQPPLSLLAHAEKVGAALKLIERDFKIELNEQHWVYQTSQIRMDKLPLPALVGWFQLNNAACAITAVSALQAQLPVAPDAITRALEKVTLAGRFQQFAGVPPVILDVAHNPHAAASLADNLRRTAPGLPILDAQLTGGQTLAIFSMLADKDIAGVIQAVGAEIQQWYVAYIPNARGTAAEQLRSHVLSQFPQAGVKLCASVTQAYQQACLDAHENDRIVVLGSFFTVAEVMPLLQASMDVTMPERAQRSIQQHIQP